MSYLTESDLQILNGETEKEWCRELFKLVKMNGYFCLKPQQEWTKPDNITLSSSERPVSVYVLLQKINTVKHCYLGLHFSNSIPIQIYVTISSVEKNTNVVAVFEGWRPLNSDHNNEIIEALDPVQLERKKFQDMLEKIERILDDPSDVLTPEMRIIIKELIKQRKKS